MLFENYPNISYQGSVVKDITIRFNIQQLVKHNAGAYTFVTYTDSDTLDTIAYDVYGDSRLWWVIAIMNDIIDPYYDAPLKESELSNYINKAYPDPQAIKHYTKDNIVYNQEVLDSVPVTYSEYETALNDSKRNIRILLPEYITQVILELEEQVNV